MRANARAATNQGGQGGYQNKNRGKQPHRKGYTLSHLDPAIKQFTFDISQVADATQFLKSLDDITKHTVQSDLYQTDQLCCILVEDMDTLSIIYNPTCPTATKIVVNPLEQSIYLNYMKETHKEQKKLEMEMKQLYKEL